jgi:hypothetical protein
MFKHITQWLATAVFLGGTGLALAQDSGPLIEMLIRKGVISDQEAEELRAELLKDFAANSPAGKLDLSTRVNRLTLALDGRIRFQYDNEVTNSPGAAGSNNDRSRYRYRFRLATTALLNNNWTLGLRLETANSATSTNDDFGAGGSTNFAKDGNTPFVGQIFVAYGSNNAFDGAIDRFDVRLGKHAHPFFTPGVNGFWIDSDINVEGLSQDLTWFDVPAKGWNLALRGGQYLLASNARTNPNGPLFTNTPSVLWVAQAELYKTYLFENNPYGTRIAPTFMLMTAPQQVSDATSYDNFVVFLLPVEHTIRFRNQPLAFYATYGVNFEGGERANRIYPATENPSAYNQMFNAGLRYGATRNPGDWQVTAEYRHVESGAYSAFLLDSDFGAGRTNNTGGIFSFSYNLTDAVNFTTTYFLSQNIDRNSPAAIGFHKAQVLQVDFSARF